nr:Subtilisin-like protease SBT3.5 [Ipomoea batatas]GME19026.1 Subtilisin-like protease SBT3.5 [Ipomoea batatas]
MYKVCWNFGDLPCTSADIIQAIDEAIHDRVDVLSLSLGSDTPQFSDVDIRSGIAFAAFQAVEHGITVVCSGGNSGPVPQTITNTPPWILTVAASTTDRSFPTLLTLGNKKTIVGESMFTGKKTGFHSLIYPESTDPATHSYCNTITANSTWVAGKIVLCFHVKGEETESTFNLISTREAVEEAGGIGVIIAKNPTRTMDFLTSEFPVISVSFDKAIRVLNYIRSSKNPRAQLSPSRTHVGKPITTRIASFSSRGPNSFAPAILKPDIAAPGTNILAAVPLLNTPPYAIESGTSMAAPHVSGIVALLKSLHPNWSPAAIKSALITTAWTADPHSGDPITAEGDTNKPADPFDYGGGIVNPNAAKDPGLVFDMGTFDYILYLCAMGYNSTSINNLTKNPSSCPIKKPSLLDINLPSVTIPSLRNSITVTRTVTNVGPVNSRYKPIMESPPGITISVKPETLVFNFMTKQISFTVTITTSHKYNTDFCFGSLTWSDGVHRVRTPISVRTEFPEMIYS